MVWAVCHEEEDGKTVLSNSRGRSCTPLKVHCRFQQSLETTTCFLPRDDLSPGHSETW